MFLEDTRKQGGERVICRRDASCCAYSGPNKEENIPECEADGEPEDGKTPPEKEKTVPNERLAKSLQMERQHAEIETEKTELTTAVEESSAKEFAELVARYQVKKVVKATFKQSLETFRTENVKYESLSVDSQPVSKSPELGSKMLKAVALASFVNGVASSLEEDVSTADRVAALTSMVPVAGRVHPYRFDKLWRIGPNFYHERRPESIKSGVRKGTSAAF
ncbi:hypothetical protein QQS21_007154 [Conoideocrella luteorostrata]|uniref:Uncharacterized protein n=1 Tax=Conoideocrella luteorostrata TaxID=1105319 RepID=A0AAJ0CNN3_9HYPO|nr:hypothetical protein QQS21_007154 [Conoideocrella luteorostrata]